MDVVELEQLFLYAWGLQCEFLECFPSFIVYHQEAVGSSRWSIKHRFKFVVVD